MEVKDRACRTEWVGVAEDSKTKRLRGRVRRTGRVREEETIVRVLRQIVVRE